MPPRRRPVYRRKRKRSPPLQRTGRFSWRKGDVYFYDKEGAKLYRNRKFKQLRAKQSWRKKYVYPRVRKLPKELQNLIRILAGLMK
jgi:hypothetical protein